MKGFIPKELVLNVSIASYFLDIRRDSGLNYRASIRESSAGTYV